MSAPANRSVPLRKRTVPEITLNNVVLPAPLGPPKPTISPSPIDSDTLSSARRPPKSTQMPSRSSMAGVLQPEPREDCCKSAAQRRQQPARPEQDHRAEHGAQQDLMADRQHALEQQLVGEIDDDGTE